MSHPRTLEQKRALSAWQRVTDVRENGKNRKGDSYSEEYGSLARSAAADILANGLGPTLAFWKAKGYDKNGIKEGGNEHAHLLKDVSDWVTSQLRQNPGLEAELTGRDLLQWIVEEASTDGYRRATSEAIAYLTWLKRFAEAELIGKD